VKQELPKKLKKEQIPETLSSTEAKSRRKNGKSGNTDHEEQNKSGSALIS
jgi:hypothetical protein